MGTLNTFIGQLHAATWTAALLAANAEHPDYRHAVKYGLQMTSGTIVLTIRKFQDMWRWHIHGLVERASAGGRAATWILDESERRNLRATANRLVAHFGEREGAWPLSAAETLELIRGNGWDTEQEVMGWGREALKKLIVLRDEITTRYLREETADGSTR